MKTTPEFSLAYTEWGYPFAEWTDLISTHKSLPTTNVTVKFGHKEVMRSLSASDTGIYLIGGTNGESEIIGKWDDLEGFVIGSNREDLTPFDIVNLERKRLRWVEHHTISAVFRDGSTARLCYSTFGLTYIKQVHQELMAIFIKHGQSYRPPSHGLPKNNPLISVSLQKTVEGEQSMSRWDIPEREAKFDVWPMQDKETIIWLEPIKTKSLLGKTSFHLVHKMLSVYESPNVHTRALRFHTYRRDGMVMEAAFALNILTAIEFTYADRSKVYRPYDPVGSMTVGTSVVLRGLFGYFIPIVCACTSFDEAVDVPFYCEKIFLPLVGSLPKPQAVQEAQQIKPEASSRDRGKPTSL